MELTFDTLMPRAADAVHADMHGALVERLQLTVRQIIEAELARAIEAVPRAVVPAPAAARLSAAATRSVSLTSREREVLLRMAAGDSNKVIARTLAVSPHTVKRHVGNILGKLGVSSRSQATAWVHAQR